MSVQSARGTIFPASSPEAARVAAAFSAAVAGRRTFDAPYRHHLLENVLPADVADELAELPFAAPVLDGVSGKRELHNDQRSYFDAAAMARFPVMRARRRGAAVASRSSASFTRRSARRSTTRSFAWNTRRTSTASGSSRTPTSG